MRLPRQISLSATCLIFLMLLSGISAVAQNADSEGQDKAFDAHTSVGDMHLGSDGKQRDIGLPVYPGSRLRKHVDNGDNSNANLSIFTSAFGFKLVVMNYDSDDAPAKVASYYRDKLKKYGKVLECRTSKHGDVDAHADNEDDSGKSKELKCDGDNTGDIIELKAGTEDNQHDVAVEPAEKGQGTMFALVYVYTRGKQGEI
jgi:hypothetical protein